MANAVEASVLLVKIEPNSIQVLGGMNGKWTLGKPTAHIYVCPDSPQANSARTANLEC